MIYTYTDRAILKENQYNIPAGTILPHCFDGMNHWVDARSVPKASFDECCVSERQIFILKHDFNLGDKVKVPSDKYEFPRYKDQIATVTGIYPSLRIEWPDGTSSCPDVDDSGNYFGMYKVDSNKPLTIEDISVGQKVVVRKDLTEGFYGKEIVVTDMVKCAGKTLIVDQKTGNSFKVLENDWYWTPEMLEPINKEEEKRMGRRTFRLVKETAEFKKGTLVQEACDDGDQEYRVLNDTGAKFDDLDDYDLPKAFSRKTVEENKAFFEEVFPVEPAFMNAAELEAYQGFVAGLKKKTVKKTAKVVKLAAKATKKK